MRNTDEDIDENDNVLLEEVQDYIERMPGYQEHLRENRGDALNFGDM